MDFLRYWKQCVAWATGWWKTSSQASSVWRLTRLYTSLLLMVVALLLILLYQLSIGQMERQQSAQLQSLLQQQSVLEQTLNTSAFTEQFQLQSETIRQYILAYQSEGQVIGRLSTLPSNMPICPESSRIPIWSEQYDEIRILSGCIEQLSQGQIFIAVDDESLYLLKSQYLSASIFALLLALLLGVITGFIFSMKMLKRINGFNETARLVESGQLSARVLISSNDDEYDHMAQHINTMLDQLESSFETISGITDAIAHDLRTPLGHLRQKMEAEITQRETIGSNTKPLKAMLESLDKILSTFASMLELTRLEHQAIEKRQHFKLLNLQNILLDAVELIEPIVEERGQTISFDKGQANMMVGDASLLFRAIYNLLENACKYSPTGARISVSATSTGWVVRDDGPGICDSEKNKVFQRLYRIEKSRQISGFGLGLALVKVIVQLHDGEIILRDNHPGLKVEVNFSSLA